MSSRGSEFGRYYQGFLKPKWSVSKLKTLYLLRNFTTQTLFLYTFPVLDVLRRSKKLLFKQFPAATCQLGQYRKTREQIFLFQKISISNREISYAYAKVFGIFFLAIFLHIFQFFCNSTSANHMNIVFPPLISVFLLMCS